MTKHVKWILKQVKFCDEQTLCLLKMGGLREVAWIKKVAKGLLNIMNTKGIKTSVDQNKRFGCEQWHEQNRHSKFQWMHLHKRPCIQANVFR